MGRCKSTRGSTANGPDGPAPILTGKPNPGNIVKTPESAFIIHFLKK